MIIPFFKAHGAKNDFLLTWIGEAPARDQVEIARAICDRHTGVGADGWMLVRPPDPEAEASIRLFNSDGSEAELSGNGTRCAAALLVQEWHAASEINIVTGAGLKRLRLVSRDENRYLLEMNMGKPEVIDLYLPLLSREVTVLDVGNPQCAVFVEDFDWDWRELGTELESHPHFPKKTNVSFIHALDGHTIDVRFFERGAGETMSSGTGSTGAAAAAIARGLVSSPVTVKTAAGDLQIDWQGDQAMLTGPAEIVAKGEFYL